MKIKTCLVGALLCVNALAQDIEWAHNKTDYKGSGQVTVKDLSGNTVNISNAKNSIGVSTSSSPLVLAAGGGGASYDWGVGFKLANGDTYIYEKTLGHWISMSNTDFDAKFTYSTTSLSKMARDYVSKTNRHNVSIVGECGNEQWHIATGKECTADCVSNSVAPMVFGYHSNYENNKDFHWISDWHNDDKSTCEVSSYSGSREGDWSFGGWVSWRFYAETRVAFPYGLGGMVGARSVRTGYEYSGSDPYSAKKVNVNEPSYTQASVEATGHYVRLNGVNRYLAFGDSDAGGGNHAYTTRMLKSDGVSLQSIPSGNYSVLETGDSYAAASGDYFVQGTNGDIYSISETSMVLVVASAPSSPVSLVSNIKTK